MESRIPEWLAALNEEDTQFLKRFVLASGSLKALAGEYSISYPTVRARLDRLIAKVQAADQADLASPFERLVRILIADGVLTEETARALLQAHSAALSTMGGIANED